MKLTKTQSKRIIKEEMDAVMKEIESENTLMEVDEEAAKEELIQAMSEPMTTTNESRRRRR